MCLSVRISWR